MSIRTAGIRDLDAELRAMLGGHVAGLSVGQLAALVQLRETIGKVMAEAGDPVRRLSDERLAALVTEAAQKASWRTVGEIMTEQERRADARRVPPGKWIAMGVCPECIHDMITADGGGQLCPECGFATALLYIPPLEREGEGK